MMEQEFRLDMGFQTMYTRLVTATGGTVGVCIHHGGINSGGSSSSNGISNVGVSSGTGYFGQDGIFV